MALQNPTQENYTVLDHAYAHFNETLFDGTLPACLMTMQRKSRAYGYFASKRFGDRGGQRVTDEIALNPNYFKEQSVEDTLSTLVHEMVHLWHQHYGKKPPCRGYHNKEWAAKMKAVGLIPSDTGRPGGKETGQKVSHYIAEEGPFKAACAALLEQGFTLPYVDLWNEKQKAIRKKKLASKTKYSCPSCGLNAWAKPFVRLMCAECLKVMEAEDQLPEPLHPHSPLSVESML